MLELFRWSVNIDPVPETDETDSSAVGNKNMSTYSPAYSTIFEHISLVTY